MPLKLPHIQQFLKFAVVSGVGWLLDIVAYTILIEIIALPVYLANLCSSYVGLLFVYFTSLQYVFEKTKTQKAHFFALYWGYHFLSIIIYSLIMQVTANAITINALIDAREHLAKIIITPINLGTNFLFMKVLTSKMRPHIHEPS